MTDQLGGCLCGAVRYRLSAYSDAGYCHCAQCRRFTGAPVAAWVLAAARDFAVDTGVPASYETRRFCGACGSSLFRVCGDAVFVYAGTLDDPNAIEPQIHQCGESQLAWVRLHDWLPLVEGAELPPPDQRTVRRGPADPTVTRESAISLREITTDNLRAVLHADVAGNQRRFVALNAASLAQGSIVGDAWYRAICADDTPVGFVMATVMKQDHGELPLAGDPDVWRFMIDSRYQGRGFGARAFELILAELKRWDGARNIWLSCVPGTGSPYEFYRRFGFVDTGVEFHGEVVMRLAL